MRLLVTAHPGTSHLRVAAPIAQAARDAGHHVIVADHPSMRREVEAYGLDFSGAGLDWRTDPYCVDALAPSWLAGDRETYLDALVNRCMLGWPMQKMTEDLLTLAESWSPDAIVREGEELGGYLLSEALGVPCAAVLSGTTYRLTPDATRGPLGAIRDELGLPPGTNPLAPYRDLLVSWVPRRYWNDPPVADLLRCYGLESPTRTDDVLPPWVRELSGTRPFVLASIGTCLDATPHLANEMLRSVIAGLGALDCDAAVSVGVGRPLDDLPDPPANVRLVNTWFDHPAMLELADAYVNHAGYGSMRESMRAGVPMVVMPIVDDQPYHADCVTNLGVARALTDRPTAEAVTAAVHEVLSEPGYRQRAAGVQREMITAPGPDQVVTDLEHLIDTPRAA